MIDILLRVLTILFFIGIVGVSIIYMLDKRYNDEHSDRW